MSKGPVFTDEQCCKFAEAASPHEWFRSADNLHQQALALRRNLGLEHITRIGPGQTPMTWDATNRATFLLGAFALESAIKAFLVYEHPDWVASGGLSGEMCSHKLVRLSKKSSLIPYAARDQWVLATFEHGNESWMRYPCGRFADDIEPEQHMHEKLWSGYTRVMSGYGKRLIRLLGRGWTGPHGYYGRWKITDEWISG